jgi:hypothetical protein
VNVIRLRFARGEGMDNDQSLQTPEDGIKRPRKRRDRDRERKPIRDKVY